MEFRLPFPLLTFDCDNGSEFLNTTLEYYLLSRERKINWTRSRPYKKNDQAHVEQKNFTHVRQLLGYSRYDDIDLVELVNDLYENAWLPLRNYFTPVMKLVEKKREGSRVKKKYDAPKTPCDRLLENNKTSDETKLHIRETRSKLDPFELAKQVEVKLKTIYKKVAVMDAERAEEEAEEEMEAREAPANSGSIAAAVADAHSAAKQPELAEKLAKQGRKKQKQKRTKVS